jgi:hypothetical protein
MWFHATVLYQSATAETPAEAQRQIRASDRRHSAAAMGTDQ